MSYFTQKELSCQHCGAYKFNEEFLKIYNSATAQQTMQNVFLGMQIFLGIVGGITLFVAGIGIANVMFISVKPLKKFKCAP